jgi:tetratricopeptide (TPR) repeat protein
MKERAREMLRMLGSINDHLKKVEPSGDKRINMWCHTCHRGRPRPMTIGEELGEVYRGKGLDTALTHFTELKENFYGKGAYNFSSTADLNAFGYEVMGNNEIDGAVKVFEMNAKMFPESANVWDSLAESHMKAGNMDKAQEYYKKSLELEPRNQNAKDMLKKISENK